MSEEVKKRRTKKLLPLVPLKDTVMLPNMVVPIFIGRQKSINAIERAAKDKQQVIFVVQKSAKKEDPAIEDLYDVGVVGEILQLLKLPDGTIKILAEAKKRVAITDINLDDLCFTANAKELTDQTEKQNVKFESTIRAMIENFNEYAQLNKNINPEIINSISTTKDPEALSYGIASHIAVAIEKKQAILSIIGLSKRITKIVELLENEINVLNTEKKIRLRVKKQVEKTQKDYYLNEQIKAIQKELTESDDGKSELELLEEKISKLKLSKEAEEKVRQEIKKLKMMNGMSSEANLSRNYIDTILSLPWGIIDKVKNDLKFARKILDNDHHGLEKVKDRILEYLAVQQRTKSLKGPIICLVGAPGVGKTSLAKSIADATERKFVRFALGGMRDEAEIRGHRRTYLGAMPGKIIQLLKKAKSSNPVFLLDEIDKLSFDYRGDPASALLEVLDPEQNDKFADHYLEVEYDLSNVLFIATANSVQKIPRPLLDRMEVIHLSGYTEEEKIQIAEKHLIAKIKKENGLEKKELEIPADTVESIIRHYTCEGGVRNLEKELAKIARKMVKEIVEGKKHISPSIAKDHLDKYLGVQRFNYGKAEEINYVGVVTGLAYTEVGGDILSIEAVSVPGKGNIKTTGKLGEVMQESAQAAYSYFKSKSLEFGVIPPLYKNRDIHLHVPEGAVPKDGPSAGVAMFTAIASIMSGVAVNKSVAMTGEITLRGRVLPIGGLKEKLLAALRGNIKTVLIPAENKKDLADIPKNVTRKLEIICVSTAEEVLKIALIKPLNPVFWTEEEEKCSFLEKNDTNDLLTH